MIRSRNLKSLGLVSAALLIGGATLYAQPEVVEQSAEPEVGPLDVEETEVPTTFIEQDYLTGSWFGVRDTLSDRGLDFEFTYTAEVWGNTTGGLKRGTVYTGLGTLAADLDLEKLIGWEGATVHNSWLWLSGRDASEDLTGNIFTISNIAGFNTFRMFELWFEQNLLDDAISLRIGQLAADEEFVISDYAGLFLNGTFGWPAFMSESLPNGGPAYPLATLGVRLALHPTDWFTFLTAGFQGNPFGEDVNRHGFRWRLSEENGYTWLNEAQFRWNHEEDSTGLPGSFKTGAWFSSARFADPGDENTSRWGNYGFYFIADQMIYREPPTLVETPVFAKGGKGGYSKNPKEVLVTETIPSDQGLGVFSRFGFEPADRNALSFYFDAGLVYTGLIPGRDHDQLGAAIAYGKLSNGAKQTLRDEGAIDPGYEIALEFTYLFEITPWWSFQPDLQVILHPGATQDLGNALVVGARSTIVF